MVTVSGEQECYDYMAVNSKNYDVYWWKLGAKVISTKKQVMQGLLAALFYKQQFGFQVLPYFFVFANFQTAPVVAGPFACTACISAAAGVCCSACAFANAHCFIWGPLAVPCLVAICGGACVTTFATCVPICLAPTP